MKLTVNRSQFLAAFKHAASVCPRRTPKLILQSVRLNAGETITLEATDLESVAIRSTVPGQATKQGSILMPAERTLAVLERLTDDDITIEGDAKNVTILGQFSEHELATEDADEYPQTSFDFASEPAVIAGDWLAGALRRTAFAAAKESARYAITGVLWEIDGNSLRLIATDGKCMSVAEGSCSGSHGNTREPVVPSKAIGLIEKHLTNTEVKVCLTRNDAVFQIGNTWINARLVEGRYPSWREVLPKKTNTKIPLSVGPLSSVLRQAAVMTDDDTRGVRMELAKGTMTLSGRSVVGRSRVQLPLAFEGTHELEIDPQYILDFLRTLSPDDEVLMETVTNNTICQFAHGDTRYVVVPLTSTAAAQAA